MMLGGSPPLRDADCRTSVEITIYVANDVISVRPLEPESGGQLNSTMAAMRLVGGGRQSNGGVKGSSGIRLHVSRKCKSSEIVRQVLRKLRLQDVSETDYELIEVTMDGEGRFKSECRLSADESPVSVQRMWNRRTTGGSGGGDGAGGQVGFELRRRTSLSSLCMSRSNNMPNDDASITYHGVRSVQVPHSTHPHHRAKDYPDLCDLPELNESTLLANLHSRFLAGNMYTYVGAILVSVNPFCYFPIYNPKYVKQYQGHSRRSDLPPHIFAIADAAYTALSRRHSDQCIVISGESGSGKTENSNFLLHHLSALSRKMFDADAGIEQCILNAGPVLEAFGNAKTVHNNNSSRFGKFVQINYRQNGSVHGACIEKYLLEKSRIVKQASNERNYHVFYYMLAGLSDSERESLSLTKPEDYFYLNQNDCYHLDGVANDPESQAFVRLRHCMEAVGLLHDMQTRIFIVLSAILHLGNVEFEKKTEHGYHDDAVTVKNMNELSIVSRLLKLSEATLVRALTSRKTMAGGETVVMSYRNREAIAARDAMSKCLYGALFDWIVLQINTNMLSKNTNRQHQGNSIGVLDIFGFEDFNQNGFEQFCINYANEALHFYFNQHIFKFEQEEYRREGLRWTKIDFVDNTGCLDLFMKKPSGLLCLLDEESNFPGATNETLLTKFNTQSGTNSYYEAPVTRQSAFTVLHYAGKVKYYIYDFREKNSDLMQRDVVVLLKNSNFAFLRELIGDDPLAVLRWALVRVFFRSYFAFIDAGRRHRKASTANLDRYGGVTRINIQRRGPTHSDSSITADQVIDSHLRLADISNDALDMPRSTAAGTRLSRRVSSPIVIERSKSQSATIARSNTLLKGGSAKREIFLDVSNEAVRSNVELSQRHGGSKIVQKNKVYKPRRTARLKTMQSFHAAASAGGKMALGSRKSKSKPPSISAQFNSSLQRLMETLNQSNPFFVRCIKSNADKVQYSLFVQCIKSNADKAPGEFDSDLVERQLRYTGMLATVQIRQAGYNYRLPFKDFIYEYSLLLPKGRLSSRGDIEEFLQTVKTTDDSYQIGETKVFLRESVKQLMEEELHQVLVARAVVIQSWTKAKLQRRRYLLLRESVILLQSHVKGVLARRRLLDLQYRHSACIVIQRAYRAHRHRVLHFATVVIQKCFRGYLTRTRWKEMKKSTVQKTLVVDESPLRLKPEVTSSTRVGDSETQTIPETSQICINKGALEKPSAVSSSPSLPNSAGTTSGVADAAIFKSPGSESGVSDSVIMKSPDTDSGDSDSGIVNKSGIKNSAIVSSGLADFVTWRSPGTESGVSDSELLKSPGTESGVSDSEMLKSPGTESYVSDYENLEMGVSTNSVIVESPGAESCIADSVSINATGKKSSSVTCSAGLQSTGIESEGTNSAVISDELTINKLVEKTCANSGEQSSHTSLNGASPRKESSSVTHSLHQPVHVEITSSDPSTKTTPDVSITLSKPSGQLENSGITDVIDTQNTSALAESVDQSLITDSSNVSMSPKERQNPLIPGGDSTKTPGKLSPYMRCQPGLSPRSSPSSRRKLEKSLSAILRAQAGPKDLQIQVEPAIVKAASNEKINASGYQRSTEAFQQKHLNAPLAPIARPECFIDSPFESSDHHNVHDDMVIVRTLIIDSEDEPAWRVQGLPKTDRLQNESSSSLVSNRSPFRQLKDNLKQIMTVGEAHEMVVETVPPPRKHKHQAVKVVKGAAKSSPTNIEMTSMSVAVTSVSGVSTWSVSGTSQWKYPTDMVIHSAAQLRQLQQFLSGKINEYNQRNSRGSASEEVFSMALKTFYETLVATNTKDGIQYRYCDLMCRFEDTLLARARATGLDSSFPATVGINGFRGYLDEFVKKLESKELPEVKEKKAIAKPKKKKENKEVFIIQCGHRFVPVQFNIYTVCEHCLSRMWPLDKGLVCRDCRLTVHRKCYPKLTVTCRTSKRPSIGSQLSNESRDSVQETSLVNDSSRLLYIVNRLIAEIEKIGMFTVGIYRKPGPAVKIKKLLYTLSTTPDVSLVDFSDYNVHVLTSVLKSVFREMLEPLMTYELYSDFVASTEITDEKEKVRTIYSLIKRLPPVNHELLEKLVFHLSRVAQQEASNCMSPQGLAISFAPSILRTTLTLSAVESLRHVTKQAECLQCIIEAQMKKLQSGLANILTLDERAIAVNDRLTILRTSTKHPTTDVVNKLLRRVPPGCGDTNALPEEAEINHLSEQIMSIQEERDALTDQLSNLEFRVSNIDDDLLSADDLDSVGEDVYEPTDSDSVITEMGDSMTAPDLSLQSKVTRQLTRHRPHPPMKTRRTMPLQMWLVRQDSFVDQSVTDCATGSTVDASLSLC